MKKILLLIAIILLLVGCSKTEGKSYEIDEFYTFAQTYEVKVSNPDILDFIVADNESDPNVIQGGTSVKITLTGKKAGKTDVTFKAINENGEYEARVYSFDVSNDLTPSLVKKDYYARFREGYIFGRNHNLKIEDDSVISVTEEAVDQSGIETGGVLYDFTVKPKSEGSSEIYLEIVNEDGTIEGTITYHTYVNDDMRIEIHKISE